jgi:hypothetical protein
VSDVALEIPVDSSSPTFLFILDVAFVSFSSDMYVAFICRCLMLLWRFLEIRPVRLSCLFWMLCLFHSVRICMLRYLDTFVVGCLLYAAAFRVILVRAATATIGYFSKNAY